MSALLELEPLPAELEPYRGKIEERIEVEAAKRGEDIPAFAAQFILILMAAIYKEHHKGLKLSEFNKWFLTMVDQLPPKKSFHESAGTEEWIERLNRLGADLPPLKPLPATRTKLDGLSARYEHCCSARPYQIRPITSAHPHHNSKS